MPQAQLSKAELLQIVEDAYADPVFFCRFFLPEIFTLEMPWVHRGVLALFSKKSAFLTRYGELDKIERNFIFTDSSGIKRPLFHRTAEGDLALIPLPFVLVMLPRGLAKTTLAIAMQIYDILYREHPFSVFVSHAAPHSKMQLNNIKRELTDGPRIQATFGEMRPGLRDDEKWSEDMFETTTGIAMIARGRGGQIRGLNHRGVRPTKIVVDDLEDKESVSTEAQRNKVREWFYGDLLPARDRLRDSRILVLGTLLHRESLLETLSQDPQWAVVRFGARDLDEELLWPVMLSEEKLEAEKRSAAAAGQLHVFYLEYFNKPIAPEVQPLRAEYIILDPALSDQVVATAIYIDPAASPKRSADKTAIAVVSITRKGLLWVREIVARRGMPESEKINTYFELHKIYQASRAGAEAIAYQVALVNMMREAMFRKGYYFELEDVPHKGRKTQRITEIIQPRAAAGYMRFARHFPDLEMEWLDFRSDVDDQPDDCLDAVAACIVLLDPFAAAAAGQDLAKDSYEPLEKVLGKELGNWAS